MNTTINNQHLEYDENIISRIKEMIENGLDKLKTFVKSKTKPELDFYTELEYEFHEISSKLEELKLYEEQKYFLGIEDMVLYIVSKNSSNNNFGYCDFTIELMDFFIDLFKTNMELYKQNFSINDEKFKLHQKLYNEKYHAYRREFYQNIFKPDGNYTSDELYEILKGWQE